MRTNDPAFRHFYSITIAFKMYIFPILNLIHIINACVVQCVCHFRFFLSHVLAMHFHRGSWLAAISFGPISNLRYGLRRCESFSDGVWMYVCANIRWFYRSEPSYTVNVRFDIIANNLLHIFLLFRGNGLKIFAIFRLWDSDD